MLKYKYKKKIRIIKAIAKIVMYEIISTFAIIKNKKKVIIDKFGVIIILFIIKIALCIVLLFKSLRKNALKNLDLIIQN